jgi:hypothetical protein
VHRLKPVVAPDKSSRIRERVGVRRVIFRNLALAPHVTVISRIAGPAAIVAEAALAGVIEREERQMITGYSAWLIVPSGCDDAAHRAGRRGHHP